MRCIAIDDEPGALDIISNYAARIPFLSLEKTYSNTVEAMLHIKDKSIDLLFLDIHMPDISGIQFLDSLTYNPLIIFSTAYSEYAVQSYEFQAVDYLLKPYEFARFFKAVSKAKEVHDAPYPEYSDGRDFMFIKSGHQQHKVIFQDILYIEGAGNYITFYTKKGKFLLRMPLKEILNILPKQLFIQVQKSFIVSLRNIDKIADNHVFVQDKRIAIGTGFRDRFKSDALLKFKL